MVLNEFGEEISAEEIDQITDRVRKLPPEKMDELWLRCGYVHTERDKDYKALNSRIVNDIMKSRGAARDTVHAFLMEAYIDEVRKTLSELEKS